MSICSPQGQIQDGMEARRQLSLSSILDNPKLPTPPFLALEIVKKASQPDAGPRDILSLLSRDPGLCGKVLKIVNSSLFGLTQPVASLERAVTVLGLKRLRLLVLSLSLPAIQVSGPDDLVGKFWQEAVAGAVIIRELAILLKRKEPEDDLVAGLLRDLGTLVLLEIFPDGTRTLWLEAVDPSSQCDRERALFGVDHAEISAGLLESWNIPADIVLPIRFHHGPESFHDGTPAQRERAWLLYFAAKMARIHACTPQSLREIIELARTRFGMDQTALAGFLAKVTPKIKEFAAVLMVDIGQCPDYAAVVAAGCEEMVRLSVATDQAAPLDNTMSLKAAGPSSTAPSRPGSLKKTVPQPYLDSGPAHPSLETLPDFDYYCLNELPAGGSRLNGYQVRELLGRGGMGVVFKAYDPMLERCVAIKMLTPERVISSDARELFMREARAAAAIQHENVITIHAVNEMNSLPYLVMEYLDGMSLQDRLDMDGPLPWTQVIPIGRQIAAGLQAAHARRLVHRDIKPANILVENTSGRVKITDFGLARVLKNAHLTLDGLCAGTPLYMAPEQFGGAAVDHRADLFSLGSLLYALAAGKPPFAGDSMLDLMRQVCETEPAPLQDLRPDVPSWLADLIARLHAKTPEQRFDSAADVVQIFDKGG